LQLAGSGFAGATALVEYLHDLGVETLYVSPVLAAVPGSTHGYDVIDPTRFDPSLGDATQFEALLAALAARGMRLLIDIVPNHMATDPANSWWWDVLRRGEASEHAPTFDIDWPAQDGKVLVPTLAEPLRSLLDRGAVSIVDAGAGRAAAAGAGREAGEWELHVDGQRFPLSPGSGDKGKAGLSPDGLGELVARQHFRPAYWRVSGDEGNYRRFFDIDGLIGVRVEDPLVFDATHRFILELASDERIAGWRVDHIDGLADPAAYIGRLRGELRRHRAPGAFVLIEKILAEDEVVRAGWEVDGTTGYEFANLSGGLFVQPDGAAAIEDAAARAAGEVRTFSELSLAAKSDVLDRSFGAALRRLVGLVAGALAVDAPGNDLSDAVIAEALRQLTVHLDAYRTYLDRGVVDPLDRARLKKAAVAATPHLNAEGQRALGSICAGMLGEGERAGSVLDKGADLWLQAARRWQQLSGAVMAKGVEDTATYRFSGLLGQAEVGSDPGLPAVSPAAFFAATAPRHRRHSSSLNATSTHDTKRSEDVRARLFTLSEVPGEWIRLTGRWHRRHAPAIAGAGGPDGHDELVAYQTLAAMWPAGRSRLSPAERHRVEEYVVKAAREAKRRTSWTDPSERYERSLRSFIGLLARPAGPFGAEMERFVRRIGPAAATNSLALAVLKSVCPGVPDVYQGTELWDFSLTDPDNRRPVDFAMRRALLADLAPDVAPPNECAAVAAALLKSWPDGRIKLHVLRALLHLRRAEPRLFDRGSYHLVETSGALGEHALGLARRHGRRWVVAFVPRLTLGRVGAGRFPTGPAVWGRTRARLPVHAPRGFTDVLTGVTIEARGGALDVGRVFGTLPVAVLFGVANSASS
jgi:malto-oligosyltrehalose synthase